MFYLPCGLHVEHISLENSTKSREEGCPANLMLRSVARREEKCEILVRKEGFEPPRPFGHKILSLARLPVPPLPQWCFYSTSLRSATPLGFCGAFSRESPSGRRCEQMYWIRRCGEGIISLSRKRLLGQSPARPKRPILRARIPGHAAYEGSAMIIQEQGDHLILIRQTDHAVLSGYFARESGNENFARPQPLESFQLAVREHDNGWNEWEMQPRIDPVTFLPYTFMSLPTVEHMDLYQRGIERVVKVDRYAGLLVSMHCAGLYDKTRATMPGFSAKYIKAQEAPVVSDFLQRLRLQQLRLKVDLRGDPATKDFADEKCLQANAQRLEALDRLSLYFCLGPLEPATIDAVPADYQGREVDWDLQPEENNAATLEPYPFRRDPLEISILARRIPKRRYADDLELQKVLAQAPYFGQKFTLQARGSRTQARVGARA